MEIIKFKKGKTNTYKVVLDNGLELKLYDDVIVKFNLLAKKQLDEKKLKEVTEYNDSLDSYYKAIKYLTTKMRAEKEIETYLKKQNFTPKIIEETMVRLRKDGYINHKVYLQAFLNDAIHLKKDGPYKIKKDLIQLGFVEEEIDLFLKEIPEETWNNRIEELITKKVKINHTAGLRKLKEKIRYDMNVLGYDKKSVEEVLERMPMEENLDALKKEVAKLRSKLEKKYPQEKVNYLLRNKLYAKGYSVEAIQEVIGE